MQILKNPAEIEMEGSIQDKLNTTTAVSALFSGTLNWQYYIKTTKKNEFAKFITNRAN